MFYSFNAKVFYFVFSDGGKMKKMGEKTTQRSNSNPANCSDVLKFGNTLNGYYIVNDSNSPGRFGIFFCQFKRPPEKANSMSRCRWKNWLHIFICCFVVSMEVRLGAFRFKDSSTPRRANLVNGLGKCLNSGNRPGYNRIHSGINLHQWDCHPSVHTMLYSWNQSNLGSSDRHICDGSKYCITTPGNVKSSQPLIVFFHANQKSQKFTFVDSLTHPGFYVIKNDHGKCLSVQGNTNKTGAQIWADDCKPSKAGQRWKWH